jgi:hypothetical protein
VREALNGTDAGVIDSTKQQLNEVLQRIGSRAYEASGPEPGSGNGTDGTDGGDGAGPAGEGEGAGEEETIEGEYKEV